MQKQVKDLSIKIDGGWLTIPHDALRAKCWKMGEHGWKLDITLRNGEKVYHDLAESFGPIVLERIEEYAKRVKTAS